MVVEKRIAHVTPDRRQAMELKRRRSEYERRMRMDALMVLVGFLVAGLLILDVIVRVV